LQGIDDNIFLPTFIEGYNQRFAVAPRCDNAHRPLLRTSAERAAIMTRHHSRKLSKNLTFQFKNTEYQLQGYGNGYRLRGASITVCETFAGDVMLLHEGKTLTYRQRQKGQRPIPIEDEKTIAARIDQIKQQQQQKRQWKPSIDQPWKRQLKALPTGDSSLSGGHFCFGLTLQYEMSLKKSGVVLSPEDEKALYSRKTGIEPLIGHIKRGGQ
jgi:hypothetical protein